MGELRVRNCKRRSRVRLKSGAIELNYNQKYKVRVHCFEGFLMFFLDGTFMFTVSDLGFREGKIGVVIFGGKARFDDITVWGQE